MTDEELDTLEVAERAKRMPDPAMLTLIAEVRRSRKLLEEALRTGERLIALFAKLTKSAGESALEDLRSQDARLALGLN